jgi:hypothetical protein
MLPFPNLFLKFDDFLLLIFLFIGIIIVNVLVVLGIGDFVGRTYIMVAVEFAGAVLLLKNGKFAYSKFAPIVNGAIAVFLVGAMFKILHWPGADMMLLIGLAGTPALYLMYFGAEKHEFTLLSILKLVLVPVMFATPLFKIMHWPYVFELQITNDILFIITLAVFIVPNFSLLTHKQ